MQEGLFFIYVGENLVWNEKSLKYNKRVSRSYLIRVLSDFFPKINKICCTIIRQVRVVKYRKKNYISYTAKSTCDCSIRLQSYSKAFSTALVFSKYRLYFTYLLTYYHWKLKRKIDFVSWPAQHFLLVIKKLYFFLFSPSCFVCSSEPTSVWWWKLPSFVDKIAIFFFYLLSALVEEKQSPNWCSQTLDASFNEKPIFSWKTWYGRSNWKNL